MVLIRLFVQLAAASEKHVAQPQHSSTEQRLGHPTSGERGVWWQLCQANLTRCKRILLFICRHTQTSDLSKIPESCSHFVNAG